MAKCFYCFLLSMRNNNFNPNAEKTEKRVITVFYYIRLNPCFHTGQTQKGKYCKYYCKNTEKQTKMCETNGNVLTCARENLCCAKKVMIKIKWIPV